MSNSTPPRKVGASSLTMLALIIALPFFVYYLWICVRYHGGALVFPTSSAEWQQLISHLPGLSTTAVLFFAGWLGLQALLQAFGPGYIREGTPLRDGSRLLYNLNGPYSFLLTLLLVGVLVAGGWLPATLLYDEFGPLLTTVNIFAFVFSLYLYWHGRNAGPTAFARGDSVVTGSFPFDYFMGTSLNPRIGTFDLKLFFEARPGLILWVLINFSAAARQWQDHGVITMPMLLVCLFHLIYVTDYFCHEEAILSTWDIRHERFGWMLCWGDLVWVPFTYTIQAFYLVEHTHDLSPWAAWGIVILNVAGYTVFRGANIQKHYFRSNPNAPVWGKPPQFIRTERGSLLLTSGWWGLSRHINYLGDLMMGLAWCLPCGFDHITPYFYIIYFTILLVHREWRDNLTCAAKYGQSWDEYRKRVPWRIVPWVY